MAQLLNPTPKAPFHHPVSVQLETAHPADRPVLLRGRIYWSMYQGGQLFWVPSEHQGYDQLPPAQELERIRLLDRQRLDAFGDAEKRHQSAGCISWTEVPAWVKAQKSESQKILQKPQPYPQTQLHQESGRIFLDEGWKIDPESKPLCATLENLPALEGVWLEQRVGRREWAKHEKLRIPLTFPEASQPLHEMLLIDQEQLVHKPTLPTSDQLVVERLFGRVPFERLDFALTWGWSTIEVERDPLRMTYALAVTKCWCSSSEESALRKRFAEFGYKEPYITQTAGDGDFLKKLRPRKGSTIASATD
jgi:hypothetical protein